MAASLVTSVSVAGSASTPAHDFTGCNFLAAFVAYDSGATFSDDQSNTWSPLTEDTPNGLNTFGRWYYVYAPTTSSTQTFSLSISYGAICVLGFTNVASAPFDAESVTGAVVVAATATSGGTIIPFTNDDLIVYGLANGNSTSGVAIDSGFTIAETQDAVFGLNYGATAAYYLQTTAANITPTWTWTGLATGTSRGAAFKSSGGGGSVRVGRLSFLGVS